MSVLSAGDHAELLRLLWPPPPSADGPSADTQRWHQQGFAFQTSGAFPLGLVQGHGGPCGVLAAVQAELLRLFLFVRHRHALPSEHDGRSGDALQRLIAADPVASDASARHQLLAEAMASLLVQCVCATDSDDGSAEPRVVRVVLQQDAGYSEHAVPISLAAYSDNASPPAPLVTLLQREMAAFRGPHGVMNFTWSVLRSKGVEAVRAEMDDPHSVLTGAFGHCTQELLNLLLTGKAVSNVFDGSVPMGDTGLLLHGVPRRPRVGYLTQLEALRYCQVGSYYKSPQFPVWVVGSSSHFSVGFTLAVDVVGRESASARLFRRVQRVFKALDPMETGFMQMASLADSLRQLGVSGDLLANEYDMARLLERLEISSGAGIVLWDEYWKVMSVLLHTNDLELALRGDYDVSQSASASAPQLQRSDSDLARELQAQFDAEERGGSAPAPEVPSAPAPAPPQPPMTSFEWFYYNGLGSVDSDAESDGRSGTRRPQLAKCRVTLESTPEFIGKSVPIDDSGRSGGHGSPPLEEILRTKWSSAQIDWLGASVPSID